MIKKRIYIIAILCLVFSLFAIQKSYAKYVINGNLQMSVYIDKTPPIINLTSGGKKESYTKTQIDLIKKADDVTLDTSDNIKIDYNEIYYNPAENNFDEKTPTNFENEKELTDEGYYKVVAVDTSGNKTEIVVLIDKTPPDVIVKYYKKGQISLVNNVLKIENLGNGGVA